MFRRLFLLSMLLGVEWAVYAQKADISEELQLLLQETTDDAIDEETMEYFMWLHSYPLSINHVGFEELSGLYFLSSYLIRSILDFRKSIGGFRYLEELMLVDGMKKRDYRLLCYFVCIDDSETKGEKDFGKMDYRMESRLDMRIPKCEGFRHYDSTAFSSHYRYEQKMNNRYKGSPFAIMYGMRIRNERIESGLAVENDRGEPFGGKDRPLGFDMYSAYGSYRPRRGFVKQLLVGDYMCRWGEGLVLWQGMAWRTSLFQGLWLGTGTTPHRSSSEYGFLRGGSVLLQPFRNTELELICSFQQHDGMYYYIQTDKSKIGPFTSIRTDGLHRNKNEEDKRNNVDASVAGMRWMYNNIHFLLGIHFLYYHFSPMLYRWPSRVYSIYEDTGNNRWVGSVHFRTGVNRLFISGELAYSDAFSSSPIKGYAQKSGLAGECSVDLCLDQFIVRINGRYYGKGYASWYNNALSAYSGSKAEKGIFMQVEYRSYERVSLLSSVDCYKSLRPRYRLTNPGYCIELKQVVDYFSERMRLRLSYVYKNDLLDDSKKVSRERYRHSLLLRNNLVLGRNVELTDQMSLCCFKDYSGKDFGYLIALGVKGNCDEGKFRYSVLSAYSRCGDYDARLYLYEPLIRPSFGIYAMGAEIWRNVGFMAFRFSKHFEAQAKFACAHYIGNKTVGSGTDELNGNKKTDITFKVVYKW